ncbi:MAG: hypothetical protein WEB56_02695 [Roseovarius sp.]
MRHISLKARAQFLKGLFLVAKEGVGGRAAMLFDICLEESGILVASPVKDDKLGVIGQRRAPCRDQSGR